jgi:hypothetical protein
MRTRGHLAIALDLLLPAHIASLPHKKCVSSVFFFFLTSRCWNLEERGQKYHTLAILRLFASLLSSMSMPSVNIGPVMSGKFAGMGCPSGPYAPKI